MLQTEYVRSLHCNYERVLLEGTPEEKRYQYCILSRGGIKGLLPCSLRYINGMSYLYFDITSRQNVAQLFQKRCISRGWIKDFLWSVSQIRMELGRFLLDEQNLLWYPEQIFQDLESNIFAFLYIPYYEGESSFGRLLDFLVERMDYEDEDLVECVYKMYQQYDISGDVYLQTQIFEDAKMLDRPIGEKAEQPPQAHILPAKEADPQGENAKNVQEQSEKKGFWHLLEGKKKKEKEFRREYEQNMELAMSGYKVAEDGAYHEEEDYGKTVLIEEAPRRPIKKHRLYAADGRLLAQADQFPFAIGKKKEEVDLVLEDVSISRIHARIIKEGEEVYLEDLNSTNGTFKNGLRLQPYEKRKLEEGDEICCGKVELVYR